jgi:FKBP-type peptidyl-prolyl cis-trans isomerase
MKGYFQFIVLAVSFACVSCSEELKYDFDAQLAYDSQLIEGFLNENGISAIEHNYGIHYSVIQQGNGEQLGERQRAAFNVTIHFLDGSFYGSTLKDIDLQNGGDGEFYTRRVFDNSSALYGFCRYFDLMAKEMTLGEERTVYVPSPMGYGFNTDDDWVRSIPPNTNLIVELTLEEYQDY